MDKNKPMAWYIGTEWAMPRKGLRKQVLSLDNFKQWEKPHLVSKVVIRVEDVQNLYGLDSLYLSSDLIEVQRDIEIGTALTPIDCYVELIVRQMVVGERAKCFIKTKKKEISFILTLSEIIETKEIHKLNMTEMYGLVLRYKENGVKMFKLYPLFAHEYFARAAKCLISYKPFDNLSAINDGISGSDMEMLFTQIQTNLAACLLNEERYEDVIYVTRFVDEQTDASAKSIYRRATAFYHLKEFDKARKLIERVPNYQEQKDFAKLYQQLAESWKSSNEEYKNLVQRMFS